MVRYLSAASGMFLLPLLTGCTFSHVSTLTVEPPNAERLEMSPAETAEVVAVVGKTCSAFQLRPDPELDFLKKATAETEHLDSQIVGAFVPEPSARWPYARMKVSVQVEKASGRLLVRISEIPAIHETDVSRGLEQALRQALAAHFPSRRIEVQQTTLPLFFGP
jgi:hypothetical protein